MQATLYEDVDGKILQIFADFSEGSGITSQSISEQVNETFQNNNTSSESRLTGHFC